MQKKFDFIELECDNATDLTLSRGNVYEMLNGTIRKFKQEIICLSLADICDEEDREKCLDLLNPDVYNAPTGSIDFIFTIPQAKALRKAIDRLLRNRDKAQHYGGF